MKSQTLIILVEPENPDNIGAVARAMKNMGLRKLRLVRPPAGWKKKGEKMAMHAHDVLKTACVYRSLAKAMEDIDLAVGTTRRLGPKRGANLDFGKAIQKIKLMRKKHRVAVVFGRESKGLDNASLDACDWTTTLPTDAACPSMNLAQAVMVVAFCLFDTSLFKPHYALRNRPGLAPVPPLKFLSKKEVGKTLNHFEGALVSLGYDRKGHNIVERIRSTLHRLVKRSGLLKPEAEMVKGLARRIREYTAR